MTKTLTIAYNTARRNPRFEWFAASLLREIHANPLRENLRLVIVDFWQDQRNLPIPEALWGQFGLEIKHVLPKPNVWQGRHRLTPIDYFNAANSRNTALCLAPDGWLACMDDLSFLMPGWLAAVKEAMAGDYICCGAYRKVKNLTIADGELVSYDAAMALRDGKPFDTGRDGRWGAGLDTHAVPVHGGEWFFGCSCLAPVEALLAVNGWCEDLTGGLGFEDSPTGIVLARNGFAMKYDRRMLTYESEEAHHEEPPMRRDDQGVSPHDKSHRVVDLARQLKRFDNGFDLRAIRGAVLAGGDFPVPTEPTREWFTGKPLCELP